MQAISGIRVAIWGRVRVWLLVNVSHPGIPEFPVVKQKQLVSCQSFVVRDGLQMALVAATTELCLSW